MDSEQEEKQRIESEKQHYADWLARAEPRQRGSATYQKRAKAEAFAYARDVVISATSEPPKASFSEVDSDLSALSRDEKRISNLLIKQSSRRNPEKRAREQATNTRARSLARLDPQVRLHEQAADTQARRLARQNPDVRSHERDLERDGRIESNLTLSRYRSQTRESMARRRSGGGQGVTCLVR
jgi:hypothetical protein